MFKARYYDNDGAEAGDTDLPIWLFDGIVNEHVLHQAVRAYRLNQRQGTAEAKTKSELRGGGRKPWRQKGTGRARHGSIRSPIWAGGGVIFPPKKKSWRVDLPKKVKGLARRSALNARAADDRVVVIDDLEYEAPKTKRLRQLLESLGVEGKVLLLTDGVKKVVYLSGRNMPRVEIMPFGQEAAYNVLWASTIVIERSALEKATADAEEAGLVEKAKARIARVKAEAAYAEEVEVADEPHSELVDEDEVPEELLEEGEARAAEVAEAVAAEEEAAEEEAAEAAAEPEPEPEEEPEVEEPEEAAGPGAVDVSEIELPTVKELADFLADFDDVDTIRALQERDDRKTAQRHYDSRIDELTGEEEE